MSEKLVQLNEEIIKGQLKELVRGSVEETLNELLEKEAESLTQAARYERSEARQGYRSGHYDRNLTTTSGDVTLHMPCLTLQFKQALADYTRCEQADGVSVMSRYRIGMTHYLMRKYDGAIRAFADSLAIAPQDDDMYIADVYWLVLLQLRAGKADEAQKTLQQHYRPDMYVGHHTAYEKAMRVAAGFAPMEDMLAELDAEPDDLQFAMTAYGLCVLLEAHGETEKVDALREKLLARDGFWFCFSYLAAYSDHKYTVKPAAVK